MNYKWDDKKKIMHIIWMIFFLSAFKKKSFRTRKILSFEKVVLLRNVVV
jgi:hypothetical protein